MRKAGKFYNAPVPQLGIMMESGKVRIDTMTLKKEDYLIDCNLRLDPNKKIFLHASEPDHNVTMEEYRKNILKEGDIVLLLKLHKHEKYILIAKVVEPE